jgi:hypothetical protein
MAELIKQLPASCRAERREANGRRNSTLTTELSKHCKTELTMIVTGPASAV